MSQMPTSGCEAKVMRKANGINDQMGMNKRFEDGQVWFQVNYSASGDVWERREGRDLEYLNSQFCLAISQLNWPDGTSSEIAVFGDTVFDMTILYTYLFSAGSRLVLIDSAGAYWDITPSSVTGLITPTVIDAPTATPLAADWQLSVGQSIVFNTSATTGVNLLCDQDHLGWYTSQLGFSYGLTTYTTDIVIPNAFNLKMRDYSGNNWKFSISTDGNLSVSTI